MREREREREREKRDSTFREKQINKFAVLVSGLPAQQVGQRAQTKLL
jgi:hypothetical protein